MRGKAMTDRVVGTAMAKGIPLTLLGALTSIGDGAPDFVARAFCYLNRQCKA